MENEIKEENKNKDFSSLQEKEAAEALINARGAINVIQRRIEDLNEVVINYDLGLNEGAPFQVRGERWGDF